MFPDPRVTQLITDEFIPVRVHVREQADEFRKLGERFGAQWTPTTLMIGPDGVERHRNEGFLPADDFLSNLELGLGRIAFYAGQYDDAEQRFRSILEEHPESEAAPEAQYWAGVAHYKATNDASALADTERAFRHRYRDTPWAKKASVWAK